MFVGLIPKANGMLFGTRSLKVLPQWSVCRKQSESTLILLTFVSFVQDSLINLPSSPRWVLLGVFLLSGMVLFLMGFSCNSTVMPSLSS
jgi:hypothetical protein